MELSFLSQTTGLGINGVLLKRSIARCSIPISYCHWWVSCSRSHSGGNAFFQLPKNKVSRKSFFVPKPHWDICQNQEQKVKRKKSYNKLQLCVHMVEPLPASQLIPHFRQGCCALRGMPCTSQGSVQSWGPLLLAPLWLLEAWETLPFLALLFPIYYLFLTTQCHHFFQN